MEHSGMLQEAENLVNIDHFEEAFDKFMALGPAHLVRHIYAHASWR
jgi:hypothetical protein